MSKWCLSTEQFGQRLEFSWLARDLTPVPNQKVCMFAFSPPLS